MTDTTTNQTTDLRMRIWSEFVDMPGLKLTLEQACRLWAADANTVEAALQALVEAAVLVRVGPYYLRADLERFCH